MWTDDVGWSRNEVGTMYDGAPVDGGVVALIECSGGYATITIAVGRGTGGTLSRTYTIGGPYWVKFPFGLFDGGSIKIDAMESGATAHLSWVGDCQYRGVQLGGHLGHYVQAVTAGVAVSPPHGAEELILSRPDAGVFVETLWPVASTVGASMVSLDAYPVGFQRITFSADQVITWRVKAP